MNRYLAAVLIFIFISFASVTVLFGLIDLVAYLFNFTEKFALFLGLASLAISIYLGFFTALKRIRNNKPWNLTLLHKSIIFAFVCLATQLILETSLYIIFARALGGGGLPPLSVIYFLATSNHIAHLPMSAISDKFLTRWAEHLYFIILLANSIIWASIFYLLMRVRKAIKTHMIDHSRVGDVKNT